MLSYFGAVTSAVTIAVSSDKLAYSQVGLTLNFSLPCPYIVKQRCYENRQNHQLRDYLDVQYIVVRIYIEMSFFCLEWRILSNDLSFDSLDYLEQVNLLPIVFYRS